MTPEQVDAQRWLDEVHRISIAFIAFFLIAGAVHAVAIWIPDIKTGD